MNQKMTSFRTELVQLNPWTQSSNKDSCVETSTDWNIHIKDTQRYITRKYIVLGFFKKPPGLRVGVSVWLQYQT